MLVRLDGEGRNVAMFARVIGAPGAINEIDIYAEAGLTVTGLIPNREHDLFGVAVAYTGIFEAAQDLDRRNGLAVIRDYEALVELSYTAVIVPGFAIQPDIQYFWNPGGRVADDAGDIVDHALVLGIRSIINY